MRTQPSMILSKTCRQSVAAYVPESANGNLLPYSAWELLEHIRLAQWDILEFSVTPSTSPPIGPKATGQSLPSLPPSAWDKSVKQVRAKPKSSSPSSRIPRPTSTPTFLMGRRPTILREVLLVADHNAYHVGELIAVRRRWDVGSELDELSD